MKYAELVKDKLIEMSPENREYYKKNADRFIKRLVQLDKAIFTAVKTIPEKNRKLLTYHDSWAYFAKRYGMKVIGAIQPSDFAEPSPREISGIIDQLKRECASHIRLRGLSEQNRKTDCKGGQDKAYYNLKG